MISHYVVDALLVQHEADLRRRTEQARRRRPEPADPTDPTDPTRPADPTPARPGGSRRSLRHPWRRRRPLRLV